ncbi:hypothetical protein Ait01nite_092920 [Actinoplanes italicus]|nr:hypothetical protein Ait01nite_092920 [Actinoplanes italicus]
MVTEFARLMIPAPAISTRASNGIDVVDVEVIACEASPGSVLKAFALRHWVWARADASAAARRRVSGRPSGGWVSAGQR